MRSKARRSAQMVVAAILIIGLMIMSVLVTVYETHSLFLRTRSPVVREVVGAITADFKRALASMLAVATRAYFNYSEFSDLTDRFSSYGMSMNNRHNFTVARQVAKTYLEYWRQSITKAYGEYGVQVSYEILQLDLSKELGRQRTVYNLMKGYWYLPTSGSYAYAKLRLNITAMGFYNWESDVLVGLTLTVYRKPISVTGQNVTIMINVRQDGSLDYSTSPPSVVGTPYGRLITKGWVRIYYPQMDASGRFTGKWLQAKIRDVTYAGMGNYSVTFEPSLPVLTDLKGDQYVPIMVVVSDERGIVVEASTYYYIYFAVQRNTPDTLIYYDSSGNKKTLTRPSDISNEVYTLEMSSNLSLFWLGQKLSVDPALKLPPFPYIPIKQIRVNVTLDGTTATLKERPIQYENWTTVVWHGVPVDYPVGLSDPQMDFVKGDKYNTKLVFQVKFPTTNIRKQYVTLWWYDDLDTEPAVYQTQIQFIQDSTHKDVWHPLYDVEFVDQEHQRSRGYVNYFGVAAFVLRDPSTDSAFGPYNLHAFGRYCSGTYCHLGRFRPYGTWQVYYEYMRYSWIKAPIRIFAVLNTEWVGSVYRDYGDTALSDQYYATLAIVQIVNGTRYIPVITYIYWKNMRSDYGYWLMTEMGAGFADYFAYTKSSSYTNQTFVYTYDQVYSEAEGVLIRSNPGILLAHWNNGGTGRAVILNQAAVNLLQSIGSTYASFSSTASGGLTGRQGSIEADFWPYNTYRSVSAGTFLRYWTVVFSYGASGSGFLNLGSNIPNVWQNAYIYASMFQEKWAPSILKP
ncbi:hypothetical protein [Thermofilum adornatum]|nr:hypothetical protein [Thermofilum adornatum]